MSNYPPPPLPGLSRERFRLAFLKFAQLPGISLVSSRRGCEQRNFLNASAFAIISLGTADTSRCELHLFLSEEIPVT